MEVSRKDAAILLCTLGITAYVATGDSLGVDMVIDAIYDHTTGKERRELGERILKAAGLTESDNALFILEESVLSDTLSEVKDEVKTEMQ